jgi:ubiquinone biosynthesis protein UbiJ
MLTFPFTGFVNHLLRREAWARERLQAHQRKTLSIHIAPFGAMHLRIGEDGLLEGVAATDAPPDLRLELKAGTLPGLMRGDDAAVREVKASGDTELAECVQFLFRNLRWDIEEDLSKVIGDAAAHRSVESGRAFYNWQRDGARRMGENFSEYWREESKVLPSRSEVNHFISDVAALRDDIARLEKRIEFLDAQDSAPLSPN